jgi:hypothetical protein
MMEDAKAAEIAEKQKAAASLPPSSPLARLMTAEPVTSSSPTSTPAQTPTSSASPPQGPIRITTPQPCPKCGGIVFFSVDPSGRPKFCAECKGKELKAGRSIATLWQLVHGEDGQVSVMEMREAMANAAAMRGDPIPEPPRPRWASGWLGDEDYVEATASVKFAGIDRAAVGGQASVSQSSLPSPLAKVDATATAAANNAKKKLGKKAKPVNATGGLFGDATMMGDEHL